MMLHLGTAGTGVQRALVLDDTGNKFLSQRLPRCKPGRLNAQTYAVR